MIDRTKLARILGMLGSANDAEVLAAARHAHRLVSAAGQDWVNLLVDTPTITVNGPEPGNGAWADLKSRDAVLYQWVMSSFETNPVARRLWSSMGEGLYMTEGAIKIGRAAMMLNRWR